MKVSFLEPAELELDDAFHYYQSTSEDLGYEFIDEILIVAVSHLHRNPEYWLSREK